MLPMPSSCSTFSQPGSVTVMVRCFSSTTKSPVRILSSPGAVIDLFALFQLRDDAVDAVVLVGGFFAGAADDERRARFVDQDRVHFVHDAEVVPALHAVVQVELHVVAQVVEAEFVVGAVGDVGARRLRAAGRRPGRARSRRPSAPGRCRACPSTPSRAWPGSR